MHNLHAAASTPVVSQSVSQVMVYRLSPAVPAWCSRDDNHLEALLSVLPGVCDEELLCVNRVAQGEAGQLDIDPDINPPRGPEPDSTHVVVRSRCPREGGGRCCVERVGGRGCR